MRTCAHLHKSHMAIQIEIGRGEGERAREKERERERKGTGKISTIRYLTNQPSVLRNSDNTTSTGDRRPLPDLSKTQDLSPARELPRACALIDI